MNVTKNNKLLKTITSFQEFEDKIKNYDNKENGNMTKSQSGSEEYE